MSLLVAIVFLLSLCCLLAAITLVMRVGTTPERSRDVTTVVILLQERLVSQQTEQRTRAAMLRLHEESLGFRRLPALPILDGTRRFTAFTYLERVALQHYRASMGVDG